MTQADLERESLLDLEFALSVWGDEPAYQRLLRLTLRSLSELPDVSAITTLDPEEMRIRGAQLHKYAGRSGVMGLNRLAGALRLVDQAIRAQEPVDQKLQVLVAVMSDSLQAAADYLASTPIPYIKVADPKDVDQATLEALLAVFSRALTGKAGTSEVDDAMEALFDLVGEDSGWEVHEAVNLNDMELMASAIQKLHATYLS